jgi:hypothetical protein
MECCNNKTGRLLLNRLNGMPSLTYLLHGALTDVLIAPIRLISHEDSNVHSGDLLNLDHAQLRAAIRLCLSVRLQVALDPLNVSATQRDDVSSETV